MRRLAVRQPLVATRQEHRRRQPLLSVVVLLYLITLLFVGLIVGGLGRLALPGPDPLTIPQTILVGVAGSLIAGLIVWAVYGRGGAGILLSVFCSAGIVYLIRRSRGGSLTDPGRPPVRRR